jgi:hypothetical protein
VDLRDAEEARRDAELAAERHERKSKTYRDENETLVLKYDRAMRQLANAADEHIGLGSLDDRGNRGGPRRNSGKSARARAAASDSGGGGESEGESRREKT